MTGKLIRLAVAYDEEGQPVGIDVLMASYVLDRKAAETLGEPPRLLKQRAQIGALDPVLAVHLAHYQLRVGAHVQLCDAVR